MTYLIEVRLIWLKEGPSVSVKSGFGTADGRRVGFFKSAFKHR